MCCALTTIICGYDKTLKEIQRRYWFPNMRKRITDHLENCFTCIMANRFEGETHLYPLPKTPLEAVHVDHFGLLQEAEKKYKHLSSGGRVHAYTRTLGCARPNQQIRKTIAALRNFRHVWQTGRNNFGPWDHFHVPGIRGFRR